MILHQTNDFEIRLLVLGGKPLVHYIILRNGGILDLIEAYHVGRASYKGHI